MIIITVNQSQNNINKVQMPYVQAHVFQRQIWKICILLQIHFLKSVAHNIQVKIKQATCFSWLRTLKD